MSPNPAARTLATVAAALLIVACGSDSMSPTPSTPAPTPTKPSSSLVVTFDQNPVPFRSTGCSVSSPLGWYTNARIQETGGVAFTPSTFLQKLDGNTVSFLQESFNSRFGACSGLSFSEGTILGNGAVCAIVGVCTSGSYGTYQFQITGADANGHALTVDSPLLQLGAR